MSMRRWSDEANDSAQRLINRVIKNVNDDSYAHKKNFTDANNTFASRINDKIGSVKTAIDYVDGYGPHGTSIRDNLNKKGLFSESIFRDSDSYLNEMSDYFESQSDYFNGQMTDWLNRSRSSAQTGIDENNKKLDSFKDDYFVANPKLGRSNTYMTDNFDDLIAGYESSLDNLFDRRRNEEQRVLGIADDYSDRYSNLMNTANNLHYTDSRQIDNLEGRFETLSDDSLSVSSTLFNNDDFMDTFWDRAGRRIQYTPSILGNLRDQKKAEQERVSSVHNNIVRDVNSAIRSLDGASIADAQLISDSRDKISGFENDIESIDTPLENVGFSRAYEAIDNLRSGVTNFENKRAKEEGRIDSASSEFINTADSIANTASRSDPYSLSKIEGYESDIDDLRGSIRGFSSVLNPGFSEALSRADNAQSSVDSLRDTRRSNLETISNSLETPLSGLEEVPLYDERELNARGAAVDEIGGQLDKYSGNDLEGIEQEIASARNSVDQRLKDLSARRDSIASDAQQLFSEIQDGSFYSQSDVSDSEKQVIDMQVEADLYEAKKAMDDIDSAMSQINAQRQRLEADAQAVEARRRERAGEVQGRVDDSGVPRETDNREVNPINIETFIERYINPSEDEEDRPTNPTGANGSFSRSLGVIRVG